MTSAGAPAPQAREAAPMQSSTPPIAPYHPPPSYPPPATSATQALDNRSAVALVLAVLGLVLGLPLGVPGLVLGPIAYFMGKSAVARIDAGDRGLAHEVRDGPEHQPGDAQRQPEDQSEDRQHKRDGGTVVEGLCRAGGRRRIRGRRVVRRDWRRRGLHRGRLSRLRRRGPRGCHLSNALAITTRWIWFVPS